MIKQIALLLGLVLVLAACGCVQQGTNDNKTNTTQQAPAESKDKVRYVQLNFLDGTSAGGEYVSESAAFTTIKLMYTLDPGKYMSIYNEDLNGSTLLAVKAPGYIVKGEGNTVSFKNTLVNTMVDIPEPTAFIENTLQEIKDNAASDQRARQKRFGQQK